MTASNVWFDRTAFAYDLRGSSIVEALAEVSEYDHESLVAVVVNGAINRWASEHADLSDRFSDGIRALLDNVHGKAIPYIGWYWRNVDWVGGRITIADCGPFIGVCQNNKWGYPQRYLTAEEATAVTNLVWEAMTASSGAGNQDDVAKLLKDLWDLFQTFSIEDEWQKIREDGGPVDD